MHGYAKDKLISLWEEGWNVFLGALQLLNEDDLMKTVTIRTQPLSAADAILRQVAHCSYHVGQIVFIGRWIKENDWKSLSIPEGGSVAYNKILSK